jgi:predicted aspartyl protease
MDGFLDEFDRACLTLEIGHGLLDFEIDTGFHGTLVIGEELFDAAAASPIGPVEADLAGDQRCVFESHQLDFVCLGQPVRAQVLVGPGKQCLLGTVLLSPHRLEIDYGQRCVSLVPKQRSSDNQGA